MLLLWAGWLVGWSGLTATLVRGARAAGDGLVAPIAASAALLLAFAAAGAFTTVVCFVLGSIGAAASPGREGQLRPRAGRPDRAPSRADLPVAGPQGRRPGGRHRAAAGHLAGRPARRPRRHAGRGRAAGGDLRRSLAGRHGRTDRRRAPTCSAARHSIPSCARSSSRSPRRTSPSTARTGCRSGPRAPPARTPFLFCETCLEGVLPQRIVTQMVKASPATETEHGCPRHSGGVLRELPEPWDLPVVAATRMSMSMPGLLHAVPLYSVDAARPGVTHDVWGRVVTDAPPASGTRVVVHTHWFCDGG
jgi:hypothetical protein